MMRSDRPLRWFVLSLWLAFILRGTLHSLVAPMWDGFDEPFHLAYVTFVANHGRPPGFSEPSFPGLILEANRTLPSFLGYGAPSFREWSQMTHGERAAKRSEHDRMTGGTLSGKGVIYTGPNYERQQGPLYYYLAAPVAIACSSCNLAHLLVALRLFSVILASLVVPLSALLAFRTVGRSGLLVALPIVTFAPNTLFFVDRVTNDALAWPLMAVICILLVEVTRPLVRFRHIAGLGIAITAGIWTKLTLLPALPAAVVAMWLSGRTRPSDKSEERVPGRGRHSPLSLWSVAVAFPLFMTALLVVWNRVSSGTFTGLAQSTAATSSSPSQWLSAAGHAFSLSYLQRLSINHLWSGGWAFIQPAARWYVGAVLIFATILTTARLARRKQLVDRPSHTEARPSSLPLVTFGLFFLAAMLFHVVSGTVAARQVSGFPAIGAEGWYLDLLRPLEALLIAVLVMRHGTAPRWLSPLLVVFIVLTDLGATASLLLPQWSGSASSAGLIVSLRTALEATPIDVNGLILVAIAGLFALAVSAGIVSSLRVGSSPIRQPDDMPLDLHPSSTSGRRPDAR
ncbi:MAG TPA: hypothetical protein VNM92_13480 [Thermoanaerobaculia bacterium]|nr:hypothetical protein [Thermoanaerobaculia bacterium]